MPWGSDSLLIISCHILFLKQECKHAGSPSTAGQRGTTGQRTNRSKVPSRWSSEPGRVQARKTGAACLNQRRLVPLILCSYINKSTDVGQHQLTASMPLHTATTWTFILIGWGVKNKISSNMAGKDDINLRLVFLCGSIVAAPESEKGFVEIFHLLDAAEVVH